jgi:PKD repeat protein
MVEFALVLPLFMLFTLIAVDFGRVYFSYVQITNAAREGANFGSVAPTNNSGIQAKALQETNAQSQGGEGGVTIPAPVCKDNLGNVINCSVSTGGAGPGNTITVTAVENFSFLTPFVNTFFSNNFVMRANATATVLGYAGANGGTPPGNCSAPSAFFVATVTSGTTVFADPTGSSPNSGVCNISGYNWTWGDGNTDVGYATGVPHTYLNAGTYTVTLQVTNQGGSDQVSHSVTVPLGAGSGCAKPTANFTWTHPSGNKTYDYRDGSTVADPVNCPITDWLWTFTDLGTQSNAQNPTTQTYNNNNSHPVTLKVTNAAGSTTITYNT